MIVDCVNKNFITYDEFFLKILECKISNNYIFYTNFIDYVTSLFSFIINNKNFIPLDIKIDISSFNFFDVYNSSIKKSFDLIDLKSDKFNELLLNSSSSIYLLSSGTTGKQKLIRHNVNSLTKTLKIGEKFKNNRWALLYNSTHIAGIQVIFQAIANKNFIANFYGLNVSEVSDLIQYYKITNLSATPTFYRILLSLEKKYELVERVTIGGEKSTDEMIYKLKKIFPNAKITNIYASTELGSFLKSNSETFLIHDQIMKKVKIINNELYIHKDLVEDKNLEFIDDFYSTGDIVEIISENPLMIKFLSRKNDIVKIGGYKVNVLEVEEIIRKLDYIKDVRVYSKPNSIIGNILYAEVVLKCNCKKNVEEIKENLFKLLPEYKIPSIIKVMDSIKITKTGKISRV